MEDLIENILVFATNIQNENDKQKISAILDNHLEINQWNIDQEDIDCVLRIETETLNEQQIIKLINEHQFECSVLE